MEGEEVSESCQCPDSRRWIHKRFVLNLSESFYLHHIRNGYM